MIVTHGTAVPGEDACEARAWRTAMGGRLADIPAVAITGAVGSMFAGAGGVEAAVAAMALHYQTVPPTVNHDAVAGRCGPPGGEADMNFLKSPKKMNLRHVVTGAFSVGGQSGALVLRRWEQ